MVAGQVVETRRHPTDPSRHRATYGVPYPLKEIILNRTGDVETTFLLAGRMDQGGFPKRSYFLQTPTSSSQIASSSAASFIAGRREWSLVSLEPASSAVPSQSAFSVEHPIDTCDFRGAFSSDPILAWRSSLTANFKIVHLSNAPASTCPSPQQKSIRRPYSPGSKLRLTTTSLTMAMDHRKALRVSGLRSEDLLRPSS